MTPVRETVDLVFDADTFTGIYSDAIDYQPLAKALGGEARVRRASEVEPVPGGGWSPDMRRVGGPESLGVFPRRAEALAAEVAWLDREVLGGGGP
jgi:hypothetical protein